MKIPSIAKLRLNPTFAIRDGDLSSQNRIHSNSKSRVKKSLGYFFLIGILASSGLFAQNVVSSDPLQTPLLSSGFSASTPLSIVFWEGDENTPSLILNPLYAGELDNNIDYITLCPGDHLEMPITYQCPQDNKVHRGVYIVADPNILFVTEQIEVHPIAGTFVSAITAMKLGQTKVAYFFDDQLIKEVNINVIPPLSFNGDANVRH